MVAINQVYLFIFFICSGRNASRAQTRSLHAGSQDNGNGKLILPQLNRLHEAFKRSQVFPPGVFQLPGPAAH